MILIDAGNSRLKWGHLDDGVLCRQGAAAWTGKTLPEAALQAWQHQSPRRLVVANVAGAWFEKVLSDWSRQHWGLLPEFITPQRTGYGVETCYHEPLRLGVDRWLALIAARPSAPVCVVDCGTALTLDFLSADGRHLGGAILPGLHLMRDSLYRRAPGIFSGNPGETEDSTAIFGQDTESCICQGTLHAVAGAIERISAEWADEKGPHTKIVTGGDAFVIQSALKERYHMQPDLVLRGLQIIATQTR